MRILPIFISHFGCPFKCIYCNQFDITKSRGINFNNITSQIKKFSRYQTSYDEIAFYGGTFTGLDIGCSLAFSMSLSGAGCTTLGATSFFCAISVFSWAFGT
jgi:histone acetyltransferase (RNA polymerase elongator complex component)